MAKRRRKSLSNLSAINRMKILLATPIYPPEIGGPSQYVKNLAEKLKKKGIEAKIISYNNLKKYPQPLKFFLYFLSLFNKAKNSKVIYAFNLISCGYPAYLTSKILKKKFIIRLGGDFLWERAVEEGRTKKPLREYYKEPKNLKEKFWIFIIKKILNRTDRVIFTSNFQKEIYKKYFGVEEKKMVIVKNPFPEIEISNSQSLAINYQSLYAGRLIKLKNLDMLIDVFEKVLKETNKNLSLKIVGEGPEKDNLKFKIKNLGIENEVVIKESLPHQELLKEIQKSYLCVLPSLTEISPNFALECIKLKKPILLTKETGIYEDFKDYLIFIDPRNQRELEEKISYLLDEKNYQLYLNKIKTISITQTWDKVVDKHIELFKRL